MRLPRLRLTVLGMMVVVAVLAVASLGGRELWVRWVRRGYRNPVAVSKLSADAGRKIKHEFVPGRSIPVSITYNFKFNNRRPALHGTTCHLLASVWFEDMTTGLYVNGYTFNAPLTVGRHEIGNGILHLGRHDSAQGRYKLCFMLYHEVPWGGLEWCNGGGRGYDFVEALPPSPSIKALEAKP